jgi:hypothetical protein
MKCLIVLAIVIVASLFLSSCSHTQAQGIQGEAKDFVVQYVAGFNAKDITRLRFLLHPKSLACMTPQAKPYYDEILAGQLRDPIPLKYELTLSPMEDKQIQSIASWGEFPVRPTQQVEIEYDQGEDHGVVLFWLVQENGRWFQDDPCASDETLKSYRDDEPARKQRIAKDKALAAAIKDPLRSELIALLRQHKTTGATQRYQDASGQDHQTAMLVIYELAPEARP